MSRRADDASVEADLWRLGQAGLGSELHFMQVGYEEAVGEGTLTSISGKTLRMEIDSILVHSDTPGAVALARQIRQSIVASGGVIVPMSGSIGPA